MEMLDNEHPGLRQPENDHDAYTLGDIFGHNVVIAGMAIAGNASAATVVFQMNVPQIALWSPCWNWQRRPNFD
jgi:hypothetical protein